MDKYKLKFNRAVIVITCILLVLCAAAMVFSVSAILRGKLLVDFLSNAFLVFVNLIVMISVINYLLNSNYILSENEIIIKTAYFKDPVRYDRIKRILYFATEDELYLEVNSEHTNIIHVNIDKRMISEFTNKLKKHIPQVPYEVSLKTESDFD